jgi:hypothetical protein
MAAPDTKFIREKELRESNVCALALVLDCESESNGEATLVSETTRPEGLKNHLEGFIQAALLGEHKVTRFDPGFEENKSLCERWSSNTIRRYGW